MYAAEGTAAHWLGEQVLSRDDTEHRTNVGAFIGVETPIMNPDTGKHFFVTQEMANAVDEYVDYCRSLMAVSDLYLVEESLPLTFLGSGEKGTADSAFLIYSAGLLEVVDYKHGAGVPVDVVGNVQGTCYGLGIARKFKDQQWDELKITIVQPRAFHTQGSIRSWVISREESMELYMEYAHYAELTWEKDAPRVPGPHCRFCRAKPCYAMQEAVTDTTGIVVDDKNSDWEPKPVESLSLPVIADLLLSKKLEIVEDWCASVRKYAQEQHESGNMIPGMKLVPTRAYRYFKDEVPVQTLLAKALDNKRFDLCFKPKELKTLAQLEKVVGKKEFAEMFSTDDPDQTKVVKRSSGVTLVSENDKRSAVKASASDDFANLID